MRIAKPLLMVSTPIGVGLGLFEGYRLAGGLVFLMAAMLGVVTAAAGTVVSTVRREQRAEQARRNAAAPTTTDEIIRERNGCLRISK